MYVNYDRLTRLVNAFSNYIKNDAEVTELSYIYEQLKSAGCTDDDIVVLGFAECIPEGQRTAALHKDVCVTFAVDARFRTKIYGDCVDTEDVKAILAAAEAMFWDEDIGNLECVGYKAQSIQDEEGNFIWEMGC